jgi:hypothetical protein
MTKAQPQQQYAIGMIGLGVMGVIADLLPHLEKGDLIIDAGNPYFKDTNLRARNLTANGIQFLGVGVSGGEEGARRGCRGADAPALHRWLRGGQRFGRIYHLGRRRDRRGYIRGVTSRFSFCSPFCANKDKPAAKKRR